MDKKTRLSILAGVCVVCAGVLVYASWPRGEAGVDKAVVESAAAGAREAAKQQPAPIDDPKHEGRARPGMLGGK